MSSPATNSVVSRKMPLVPGIISLLSFFGQPSLGIAEEYTYVFNGASDFGSKYRVATYTMELNGTEANGSLKFIDQPTIGVTGSNYQPGRLRLTFGTTPPKTVDFEKRVWGEEVSWDSQHPRLGEIRFSRSFRGPPSEAALELSDHECGPHNGAIDVRFQAGASLARLQQVVEADPILTNINASYLPSGQERERRSTLASALVQLHTDATRESGATEALSGTIKIQNGTELTAVRKLRSLPVVEYADLSEGGCGGAERSYFIVQNVAFFENDVFSEQKFLDYVENGLRGMLGHRVNNLGFNFRLGNPVNGRLRVPPFTSYVKYKVVAASEITRGEPRYWDRFFVTFEPSYNVANTTSDMSVVVTVESLSISRRSRGSDAAPGDEQFTTREDMGDAEAIITTSIERYFAGRTNGIRCVFAREGFDLPSNRPSCS